MNKTVNNNANYKITIFWAIIGLLSLIFIGIVVFRFIGSQTVNSMDDLTNLRDQQIFQQEGTYYVYVYSKVGVTEGKYELEKAKNLEETILTYLTYVKRTKDANRMYGMIVDSGSGSYGNNSCLIDENSTTSTTNVSSFSNLRISKGDIPILLKITDGKIVSQYLTESKIREELQKAMGIE